MSPTIKRKPIAWIIIDLFGLLILQAGAFQYFELDIPYITPFFADFSTTLLLSLGAIIMLGSMLLYIVPIIKANNPAKDDVTNAVERTKR